MLIAEQLAGRHVLILGLARQGLALARFLLRAGAIVTISDMASADKLAAERAEAEGMGASLALGGHPLALLEQCDLLCLSGGVPPQIAIVQEAIGRGIRLSNDSLLTLQVARERGLGPTVAITGSSGKTTTTTLVGRMLQAAGLNPHVGGNIGVPLIDRLDAIQPGQPIVLELSSFQLELFDPAIAFGDLEGIGPEVAAILNVTPNHLDRHPSMAAYVGAKFNLVRRLHPNAALVLGADDAVTGNLANRLLPTLAAPQLPTAWNIEPLIADLLPALIATGPSLQPFSRTRVLESGAWMEGDHLVFNRSIICHRNEVRLRGNHNVENLLAATAISGMAGATIESMTQVARSFEGVRHRLEVVLEQNGVTWINDSIATSPERAVAGVRSFDPAQNSIILLAGGKDKNLPWETFADEVLDRVRFLIGFGQAGSMIVEAVRARAEERPHAGRRLPGLAVVLRLEEAVELAARSAPPGAVVLLSPGGTSYDAYRDFEARGMHFSELAARYAALAGAPLAGAELQTPQTQIETTTRLSAAEGAD
ncbi:MAG: UDP-N-acetylmuramoyl-L-alanine--D-glutamate ligase [Caldilineaceae bacterium]